MYAKHFCEMLKCAILSALIHIYATFLHVIQVADVTTVRVGHQVILLLYYEISSLSCGISCFHNSVDVIIVVDSGNYLKENIVCFNKF